MGVKNLMDKRIFLSYCQANEKEANKIDEEFIKKGITLTRDKRDLRYKQNIEDFMKKIREHDFAILLISNEYLISSSCMYEFLQVLKEKDFEKKILPIIMIKDFFNSDLKIVYIKHWKEEINILSNKIKEMVTNNMGEHIGKEVENLRRYKAIENDIGEIIEKLQKGYMIIFSNEEKQGFKTIFEEIGINNKEKNITSDIKKDDFFSNENNFKNISKTNIGIATANIFFKSRDAINHNEKSDKSNNFENGKQKLIKGIVDNDVIQYITEILLKKDMLCRFIIKYGDDSIEDISNAILKLNNELQERVMKNIQYGHAEATGYENWKNYDYFGVLSVFIYRGSSNGKIKEIAYNIIENCSRHRFQFCSILKELDEEKYI